MPLPGIRDRENGRKTPAGMSYRMVFFHEKGDEDIMTYVILDDNAEGLIDKKNDQDVLRIHESHELQRCVKGEPSTSLLIGIGR